MRGAVALEIRQCQTDAARQALPHAREQKSLLMRGQQHVELSGGEKLLDEGEIPGRVVPQARTAVEFPHEAREP